MKENKQHETIVKGIRLHRRLFEQAQQTKGQYEVPISFNRFVVNAIEKEVERKGAEIDSQTLPEGK